MPAVGEMAKAALMALSGMLMFGQLLFKLVHPQNPAFEALGAVGALALAV